MDERDQVALAVVILHDLAARTVGLTCGWIARMFVLQYALPEFTLLQPFKAAKRHIEEITEFLRADCLPRRSHEHHP